MTDLKAMTAEELLAEYRVAAISCDNQFQHKRMMNAEAELLRRLQPEGREELFAELYQIAGVLHYAGLVPTLLLDKLSAAQRGLSIPAGDLLPFMLLDHLLPCGTNEGTPINKPAEAHSSSAGQLPMASGSHVFFSRGREVRSSSTLTAEPQPQSAGPRCPEFWEKWHKANYGSSVEQYMEPWGWRTVAWKFAEAYSRQMAGQTNVPQMGQPERFYVASRASVPERSAMWRSLRASGWQITSTWIDEAGEGETEDFGELWQRIMREIAAADALILYAEKDDFPLKGALVEVGIALGMKKPVFVCLPGVELQGRTFRPIGSWITHSLVKQVASVEEIKDKAPARGPQMGVAEQSPKIERIFDFRYCELCGRRLLPTPKGWQDDSESYNCPPPHEFEKHVPMLKTASVAHEIVNWLQEHSSDYEVNAEERITYILRKHFAEPLPQPPAATVQDAPQAFLTDKTDKWEERQDRERVVPANTAQDGKDWDADKDHVTLAELAEHVVPGGEKEREEK